MVSALSSTSTLGVGAGRGRGRYERVGTDQPHEDEAGAGADGAVASSGLTRSASLVSALSSAQGEERHDTRDIPPPTPISDHTPTFTSATVRGQRRPGSQENSEGVIAPGRNGAR